MSDSINPLSLVAAAPSAGRKSNAEGGNWFEAMAEAWGRTLDAKAAEIEATADQISGGDNQPATITQLSAQSLEMSFLSNSSHTSLQSVGSALETMARKQ